MRNYQERKIWCGFAKLRKYDRVDLFWGLFKNVERDMVRVHALVGGLTLIMIVYILASTDYDKQQYAGNI